MATKRISELSLRSDFDATCNVPVDDASQSFRVTAVQIFDYILAKFRAAHQTVSAAGTTLTSASQIVLLDPTSVSFTQALPACASLPTGMVMIFKNIATNGNTATLDASTTETIDGALTLELNSLPSMDAVKLYNTGTAWLVI